MRSAEIVRLASTPFRTLKLVVGRDHVIPLRA